MQTSKFGGKSRAFAALIALVTGVTLVLRVILSADLLGGVPAALSHLSQFFTILTNTLVFLTMLLIALGVSVWPRVLLPLTIAIVGVGLVYHAVLAQLVNFTGLAWLADHGVHTVVPLLTLIWWVWYAPKVPFELLDLARWIAWPLIYCGYILIRASFSGFYPYPFLNLPELGVVGLAQSIATLVVAFVVIGGALKLVSRIFGSRSA